MSFEEAKLPAMAVLTIYFMKKIFLSVLGMSVMTLAGVTFCHLCHGFAPCTGYATTSQQLTGVWEWLPVLCLIGFFTGFLPVYIYESIKAMRPHAKASSEPVMCQPCQIPAILEPTFYVGQTFTSPYTNCIVRIKSIKKAA